MIIFLDGNPSNLSKENLLEVTPKELRLLYKEHRKNPIRGYPMLAKAILLNIKLDLLIKEKQKIGRNVGTRKNERE
ncbi:hypothetical protein [Enterococcus cecorum]|uniref:hypothetical protein n=1 Tax=Enterococcus cecorum TaxID=44008 RepID=UPI00148BDE3F|nr:hypothetical protein [Enterococcus cecorum]